MDPFGCYFRNVRLTPCGEYETLNRTQCTNQACLICDQFFSDMKTNNDAISDDEDVKIELDDQLLDIVTEAVSRSYSKSNETVLIIPEKIKKSDLNLKSD